MSEQPISHAQNSDLTGTASDSSSRFPRLRPTVAVGLGLGAAVLAGLVVPVGGAMPNLDQRVVASEVIDTTCCLNSHVFSLEK